MMDCYHIFLPHSNQTSTQMYLTQFLNDGRPDSTPEHSFDIQLQFLRTPNEISIACLGSLAYDRICKLGRAFEKQYENENRLKPELKDLVKPYFVYYEKIPSPGAGKPKRCYGGWQIRINNKAPGMAECTALLMELERAAVGYCSRPGLWHGFSCHLGLG